MASRLKNLDDRSLDSVFEAVWLTAFYSKMISSDQTPLRNMLTAFRALHERGKVLRKLDSASDWAINVQ